jgi:hypothetical protein
LDFQAIKHEFSYDYLPWQLAFWTSKNDWIFGG